MHQSTNKLAHPKNNGKDIVHPAENEILTDRMHDLRLCSTGQDYSKTEYSAMTEDTSHYHRQIQQSQGVLQELRKSIREKNFNHTRDSDHSYILKSETSTGSIPDEQDTNKQHIPIRTGTNGLLPSHPHLINRYSNESALSDMSSKWSEASYSMRSADENISDLADATGTRSVRGRKIKKRMKNATGKRSNGSSVVPSPLSYEKNDILSASSQDDLSVQDNNSLAAFSSAYTDSEEFKRMVELTRLNNDIEEVTDKSKSKTKTKKRKKSKQIFQIDLDEPYNRNETSSASTEEMVLYREHGIYIPISSRIPIKERLIKGNTSQ